MVLVIILKLVKIVLLETNDSESNFDKNNLSFDQIQNLAKIQMMFIEI